jgi:putative FmdB family regulatory protein
LSIVSVSARIRAQAILPRAVPIYEYRCENGHLFEVMQRITDDPVAICETCDASVQRVFHPVAVHFKGSGFYNTDYGTSKRKRELEQSASEGADKHDSKRADERKKDESGSASGGSTGSGGDSSSSASSDTKKSD